MKDTMIDVIIPVYNAELYLKRCLKSVINQTYKNIRIIIINDGSTDKSADIIESFVSNDDRCVAIKQENKGIGATRNVGLANIQAKYFMFVDADDEIALDYVEKMVIQIEKSDADIAVSSLCDNSNSLLNSVKEDVLDIQKDKTSFYEKYVINNLLYYGVTNKMFKTEKVKGIWFENNCEFGEDLLFMLKFYLYAMSVVIVKEAKYYYSMDNTESLTRKKKIKRCFEQYRVCELFYNYLKENDALKNNIQIYSEILWMLILSGVSLSFREGADVGTVIKFLKFVVNSDAYRELSKEQSISGINRFITIEGKSFLNRWKLRILIYAIRKRHWKLLGKFWKWRHK